LAIDQYHTTFIELAEQLPVEDAAEQTRVLYDNVIAARHRLREHEESHGCHEPTEI
jgi:hypothetical protein